MTDTDTAIEPGPPAGHVKVVYLGPVAPHWEIRSDFGDRTAIEEFRARAQARLVLLPPHDPQFRRNRERVNRVIFHVERHLGEPLHLEELARVACFSPFHFHRIFAAFTGEPLAAFIRRLRLERAA